MVVLRPTRKLSSLLPATGVIPTEAETALGDWYVTRLIVDRKPLLLLVSSASLLPILVPARDVRGLPDRLVALVGARLKRCHIAGEAIDAEIRAMVPVAVGPTVDRSVLGIMVDFAKAVPYHLEQGQWAEAILHSIEDRLAETPCHATLSYDRVIFPERKTQQLLRAKWLAQTPL